MEKDFVLTLLSSGTVGALLSGMVVWLSKSWISERLKNAIKNEYDLKLEAYKQTLKSQSNIAIEQLKSSLAIQSYHQNTRVANLLQRRFDAIATIVPPLLRLRRAVSAYTSVVGEVGGDSRQDQLNAFLEAQKTLIEILDEQAIFLDEDVATRVHSIRSECEKAARLFRYFVDVPTDSPAISDSERWLKVVAVVEENAPLAIAALERELRSMMGVALLMQENKSSIK